MRKGIAAALAAVTAIGSIAATAVPAAAQSRYYDGRRDRNNGSTAIIAGIAGLAIGAAIAGSNRSGQGYYARPGYGNGYGSAYGYVPQARYGYGQAYGYRGGYQTCTRRDRVYDPYRGRYVTQTIRFAC